jgi:hypothetical protein
MSDKGWSRTFHDPIPLPGGGELRTLREAANYITNRSNLSAFYILDLFWGSLVRMERSLITDMPRDKYVERCKQRAFDYLDQGDLKKAAALFVSDMNARPDCELPDHLIALSASLLIGEDVLGWDRCPAPKENPALKLGEKGGVLGVRRGKRRDVSMCELT